MFGLTVAQIENLSNLVGITAKGNFEMSVAQKLTPDIITSAGLSGVDVINFNFLGLNLGATPNWAYLNWLWVIPVLAALTTFLSTKVMPGSNNQPQTSENSMASAMKSMNMFFPLMTAYFAFSMPAGVGLYWILGNIIQIIQQLLLNKFFTPNAEPDPLIIEKAVKKPNKGGKKK